MDVCPCKDCVDERTSTCHSTCDNYKKWKARHDEKVAQERAVRESQYSARTGGWYKTADGHWRNNKSPKRRK